MSRTWIDCKLGDVVTLKRGYDLPQQSRIPGSYPIVSSSGITDHHIEAKVRGPGVVTGRYGTLGEVFYVEGDFWPLNTALYVRDFKGNDPRFISYFLRQLNFGTKNAAGAVPGVNRNHLHAMDVRLPPLSAQRSIVRILSRYDDLIENCQRRIRVLDEMARTLYREWFVNFRYPGHEKVPLVDSPTGQIPKGWEIKPLGRLATVTMGLSPRGDTYNERGDGTPLVNGPVEFGERFTKRIKWTTSPTKICRPGDLVVCVRGSTTGKFVKSDGTYCLGRGVCGMRSDFQAFLDLLFLNELPTLLGQTSGSTFPSWTGPQLQSHPVLSPSEDVLARFEALARPLSDALSRLARASENPPQDPRSPPPPSPLRPTFCRRRSRMTPHAYTEAALVEDSAEEILVDLGWSSVSAAKETFGPTSSLGRDSAREVVITSRLRAALSLLNPAVPPAAIDLAVEDLLRDRIAMGPAAANREVHRLLTDGVKVVVKDASTNDDQPLTIRIVDWESPERNDFLAVRQLTLRGPLYTCIPDIVLFVNGLPWVVIELKRPGVPARQALDENLTSYKHPQNGVPQLFAYNAFLIASNGTDGRVGSLTADWDRFFEWKRIEREDEPRRVSLDTLLRGTCDPRRLLDLVQSFTLFSEHKTGLTKILGQNHQFLGVNNAIRATLDARAAGHGRAGVFWQTQGSGKSFSMVFYAQKILRAVPGNWTFVVITDRTELDDQIAKTFAACGAVEDATKCHAQSGAHLRQLLAENHRYVFTLIQKFRTADVLCDRRDVIVIVDEAHRSQYDDLAMNMRAALPNALFVAFTGTPLIAGEERTREVFGDYVSVYDFQQSIEDGATVPLFYENRTPELKLTNPSLNEDLYDVIDEAALDEESEVRVQKLLGRNYHLITRDDRLDTIAGDIVNHFLGRGFQGKAMVVSIDKATALRTYEKVRRAWDAETVRVQNELRNVAFGTAPDDVAELKERLARLTAVDMAVIVSPGQNEIEDLRKVGIDIVPHRKRMAESQPPLDERFKDPDDPLSLVFVCAMWLTGFDAPSVSTVYLDKPMRNHTLMQTIARANRVYPGKQSGVIVDYANVFASIEKALSIYGTAGSNRTPVRDKEALVEELRDALGTLEQFCEGVGVHLGVIEASEKALVRLTHVGEAANLLVAPVERRKAFLSQARLCTSLYRAIKPHKRATEFAVRMATIGALAEKITSEIAPEKVDLAEVLGRIGEVLDRSIEGAPLMREGPTPIDLSKIDFGALAARFKDSRTKSLDLERLKAAIRAQLDRLISVNETRVDLRRQFETLIEAYNAGSTQIEQLFLELLHLSRSLTDEEARHVREQLTEEELVVFDLLTRPGPELSTEERNEVKKVATKLLAKLRGIFTIDWQRTTQARARVREAIEETLDEGLPRAYTPEVFKTKAGVIFQHVYERYSQAA